tara:strand:- start:76425 stop:76877 length:453 start_codon:yes stop_codon:yes gene_type:complete
MLKNIMIILILVSGLSLSAEMITCSNPNEYGYGNQQNILTIEIVKGKEDQYLNGRISFRGYELHNYFSSEINAVELNKQTTWFGGGGRSFYVYSIEAHINLNEKSAVRSGRFEAGFRVFPDYGGIKIISLQNGYNTGKDWWFKDCHYSKY